MLDLHPRPRGWPAELSLRFVAEDGRTTFRQRRFGPLVVQKALYPEGPELCHIVVLHPPGGIVGGDALRLDLELTPGSRALVTSPGATRWYRSSGEEATQQLFVRARDAAVEWLPQETIVYDDVRARSEATVELFGSAVFFGWELLCLGRTASGERFERGWFRQRWAIRKEGRLLWSERARLAGADPLLASPVGLDGRVVTATLVLAGVAADPEVLAACRAVTGGEPRARVGVTAHAEVIVARYLGDSGEAARRYLVELWQLLRPRHLGRPAVQPRIWST